MTWPMIVTVGVVAFSAFALFAAFVSAATWALIVGGIVICVGLLALALLTAPTIDDDRDGWL